MSGKHLRTIELLLLIFGLVLVAFFFAAHLHRSFLSRAALESFKAATEPQIPQRTVTAFEKKEFRHDFSLWSSERIAAYRHSLTQHFEPPLAILRISKVRLEVPVLSGTDDVSLNRGVGLIQNTARPGDTGNISIAGHRDGFFRALKDVGPGEMIELESPDQVYIYQVQRVVIVKPDDVSVVQPTSAPQLTLITCYPFYFVGSAPKRYVVQASLVESRSPTTIEPRPNENSARSDSALQRSDPQPQKSTKEITQ